MTFSFLFSIIYYTFATSQSTEMKSSELYRKLLKAGWYEVRQTGSHKILMHDLFENTIVFPYHGSNEVAKGTEKALLKQAGLK